MKKFSTFLLLFTLVQIGYAQNPQEIINRYFSKVGGTEKWKTIKNMVSTGKKSFSMNEMSITSSNSKKGSYIEFQKYPRFMRLEQIEDDGSTSIVGFDGDFFWLQRGDEAPQRTSGLSFLDLYKTINADMVFNHNLALIDHQAKGYIIEYKGMESLNNQSYDIVKVIFSNRDNDYTHFYFNKTTGLIDYMFQSLEKRDTYMVYSNYKEVEGMLFPFDIIQKGTGRISIIKRATVEINSSQVNDDLFAYLDKNSSIYNQMIQRMKNEMGKDK